MDVLVSNEQKIKLQRKAVELGQVANAAVIGGEWRAQGLRMRQAHTYRTNAVVRVEKKIHS